MSKLKMFLKSSQLAFLFAAITFVILLITMMIVFFGIVILNHFGISMQSEVGQFPLAMFMLVSVIIGSIVSLITSRVPLRPIRQIIEATEKITDGDYSARISLRGTEELRRLGDKFNHMAEELGSVEVLRTDFVNDFSHEFKTPIVSIRGFARMLKNDDLTDEERSEYLDIIIRESERLSDLSTNVLNLSRLEQQTILTDKKKYNLSEQLRSSIAMMDSKWTHKHMDFQMYGSETFVDGNENLLKEVWLNLLDNAIKFSASGDTVKTVIRQHTHHVTVEISNKGEPIPAEKAKHIFDKFYQGDDSHATKGNGLGLTIAKRVVDLHGGEISVGAREGGWVVFTVKLPEDYVENSDT